MNETEMSFKQRTELLKQGRILLNDLARILLNDLAKCKDAFSRAGLLAQLRDVNQLEDELRAMIQ